MGKTGHGRYVLCSHHMHVPTDVIKSKGRYKHIIFLKNSYKYYIYI
jgi:hypothetical protein